MKYYMKKIYMYDLRYYLVGTPVCSSLVLSKCLLLFFHIYRLNVNKVWINTVQPIITEIYVLSLDNTKYKMLLVV